MKKEINQVHYVRDVLGVQSFLKPSSFNYRFYGSFDSDCFLFFCTSYEGEDKKLIQRMMKALGVRSYGCVSVFQPLNEEALRSLVLRSQATRVCFFGDMWKPFLKKVFDCDLSLNQFENSSYIRVALTFSLEEFRGDSQIVRQRKVQAFNSLKKYF